MANLLCNNIEDISIIKQEAIDNSYDSIANNDKLFPNNNANEIKRHNRNKKDNQHNKKKEYNQTTPAHKKTFSTKISSAQQFACRFQSKIKLLSPMKPRKLLESPAKEVITMQLHSNNNLPIINELQMLPKANAVCQLIQSKTNNKLVSIQEEFVNELDVLYLDNLKRIRDVNENYDYELYKSLSETNNTSSSNDKYNQMLSEKNSELSEIENEFLLKKNTLLTKFNTRMCLIRDDIIKQMNDNRNDIKNEIVTSANTKINPNKRIVRTKQLSTCCSAKKGIVSQQGKAWKI